MIRAILTSGSMRSLRHKPDRSCATKPGHISCHRHRPISTLTIWRGRARPSSAGARWSMARPCYGSRLHADQAVFRCARLRPGRRCRGSPNSATQASNTGWTEQSTLFPQQFLAALVERLLAAKLPGPELRWPGRTLRLADGTCVSKPGRIGTDWRVHGVFDLGRGGFSHLELTDQHGAEALERGAPHPGEIRIGDRNYARASVLQRFRAQSGGSADFIVRLGWNALQLTNPAGKPFDLIGYLQGLPPDQSPHEVNLRASVGRDQAALAVRLIVQRKTPEAAEAT